ncbi:U32 family peptidase C-terminal domain-containing protein [Candidatus Peribacteria bacterium]|nr:U32 family peptidase C-terminal domain-containing protein [Candidatus Peribacteria bacterium]
MHYDKNAELKEEDFVGIIREYNKTNHRMRVEVKNRFDLGDTLRLIGPETAEIYEIREIYDPEGNSKTAAHG